MKHETSGRGGEAGFGDRAVNTIMDGDEHHPSELEILRGRTDALQAELNLVRARLAALESRRDLAASVAPGPVVPGVETVPKEELEVHRAVSAPRENELPGPAVAAPPVIPEVVSPVLPAKRVEAIAPAVAHGAVTPERAGTGESKSIELQLGTYWLARLGVVMLLTALVFFGKFAYQSFIVQMGPVGKLSMMYLGAVVLLGLGGWFSARRPALRSYGQVLIAGGLAAVYFTTYAAHHFPNLRVISSPVVDGVLLLAWAGVIAVMADRQRSEALAMFAVGLAFYTSVMTRVGLFTLYSNVLLTALALLFLWRHRWAALSCASLVGTYLAYGFWRFFRHDEWRWAMPDEGLWTGVIFLGAYWVMFTAAVFLSRHERLTGAGRVTFASLNNGAFFTLFVMTLVQVDTGGFWKFSLLYGAVLLGVAGVAARSLPGEPRTRDAYLAQGLVLVTVGWVAKFSGLNLALLLAAESTVLLLLGSRVPNRILVGFSFGSAAIALPALLGGLERGGASTGILGIAVGGFMVFNAVWQSRAGGEESPETRPRLRGSVTAYAAMGLAAWLFTSAQRIDGMERAALWAGLAMVLAASIYVVRVAELAVLGQGFLILALADSVIRGGGREDAAVAAGWVLPVVIACAMALSHWWQRQRPGLLDSGARAVLLGVIAVGVMGVVYRWVDPWMGEGRWLPGAALIGLGLTAYGVVTRAGYVAAAAQVYVLGAALEFARATGTGHPAAAYALVPIGVLLGLSAWEPRVRRALGVATASGGGEFLSGLGLIYRWLALLLALGWVREYVPGREQVWVLVAGGGGIFALAAKWASREAFLASAVFTSVGLLVFWVAPDAGAVGYGPSWLAILAIGLEQQYARRHPSACPFPEGWQSAMMGAVSLSLWRLVSEWVRDWGGSLYLTGAWAMVAFVCFAAGLLRGERVYRWVGLSVLGAALARVIVVDVWRLDTIYRVLSFFALGVVLLSLGFLYNRYQERIRKWL